MPRKVLTAKTTKGTVSLLDPHTFQGVYEGEELDALRRQATDIIDSILAETGPEGSEIRDRLRRCLSRNRSHPERALLQHLMSTRAPSPTSLSA
jgi:hypothetical protein